MSVAFFEKPILNSPYTPPRRHWEFDPDSQPPDHVVATRRRSDLIVPVPKPKKRKTSAKQSETLFDADDGLSTSAQEYNPTPIIVEIRGFVERWRALPKPEQWQVSPETARLLQHWRRSDFAGVRRFIPGDSFQTDNSLFPVRV